MKRCIYLFLHAVFLVYPYSMHAAESGEQPYALSRAAARQAVCQWLNAHGYSYQVLSEPGGVLLLRSVSPAAEPWQLELRPHSPLSTAVTLSSAGSGEERTRFAELLPYLKERAAGDTAITRGKEGQQQRDGIPGPVLDQIGTVVCVRAGSPENTIQFSGFFIEKGLVLCTAHDLGVTREVSIVSTVGVHFKGEIIQRDPQRDLALIRIEDGPDQVVSLAQGRNLVGMGERIFSIGCPVALRGTVNAGFINGPPRRLHELPLWQADIAIQPGSSGSPVFDSNGVLIAVVKGRHRLSPGIGFLIPLEVITDFLQEKSEQ
ncbi:MAG: serine protease [Candidatus Electrothrix sp. GW3-4]|uniref:S1C family serine protease n=1 Tax=Candidatus Electrothrix sp. GW3-4 TaxID=3126740 RepID=UPI0030CE3E09